MTESKHSMKLRHKAELKTLLSQPAKGIGAKKKQKDDEKAMIEKHDKELKELENKLAQATLEESSEPSNESDSKSTSQSVDQSNDASTNQESTNQSTNQSNEKVETKSRAQLKREKKSLKEKERRAELIEETASMSDPRGEENQKLSIKLSPSHLQVREVLSDGHCLFRAVADQLSEYDPAHHQSHEALRVGAANHIRDHLNDYQPFLCSEDGEPFDQTQAQQYCKDLQRVDGDVVWGGHAEIVALSDMLHHPIIVHSAEGNDLVVNGMSEKVDEDAQPLHISFHKHYFGMGNHYNSVVEMEENSDDETE